MASALSAGLSLYFSKLSVESNITSIVTQDMDEDGFIFIADRLKDMIVTGGENVYSGEVEKVVARHACILQ